MPGHSTSADGWERITWGRIKRGYAVHVVWQAGPLTFTADGIVEEKPHRRAPRAQRVFMKFSPAARSLRIEPAMLGEAPPVLLNSSESAGAGVGWDGWLSVPVRADYMHAPSIDEPGDESRATKDVFRNLQKEGGHSFAPVGYSFGKDREVFEERARSYLSDRSRLSSRTIDKADWDVVFRHFTSERED